MIEAKTAVPARLKWLARPMRPKQDEFAMAFKTLALEVNRMIRDSQVHTILFASAYPRDGKTLIVASLGMALADLGMRVTLVEASRDSTTLVEQVTIGKDVEQLTPGSDGSIAPSAGLTVIPGPALPLHHPDPEEMRLMLVALQRNADIVFLDSVACNSAPDAYVLAPLVDGVLYVVRRRQQDVVSQRSVIARLERFGARILGALYNEYEQQ